MPDLGNTSVFSQTDASNNTGTMPSWSGSAAPSTLDDAGRAFQGAVTREWNWRNVTLTTGGTSTAYTLTYSVAPAAYYNGQRFAFIVNAANTAAATLNVNSLGAKNLRKMVNGTATALNAGDLAAGAYVEVAYNTSGDYFVILNRDLSMLVPDSNANGFLRNRIINGGFSTDQRNAAAAQTITAAAALAYTADRWYAWCTGANVTGQRVAGTAPAQYAYKFTGATSNTLVGFAQRIEQLNSYDLASGDVTISAIMTASTNTTITWVLNGPSVTADTFGTIASPTVTQVSTGSFSVTTTRTKFTATIPAATMSGFNKGLELIFKAASGLGNAVTWTIEDVQLEAGSVATPFERRQYGQELLLCQRYYETVNVCAAGAAFTNMITTAKYAVVKRTAPSVTRTGNWVTVNEAGTSVNTGEAAQMALINSTASATAVGGTFTASAEL